MSVPVAPPVSDRHVPALDGVRGLAITMVVLFHAWRAPVTALGWAGVDLFFVLSGFLITGILADTRDAPHRARTFYARRALRILPLYYGALIAVFVARPLLHLPYRRDDLILAGEHLWYWTYLCAWRIGLRHPPGTTFLTHFWSLSIEEQFYLVWPWVVWSMSRRSTVRVAVALCIVAPVVRALCALATPFSFAAYMLPPCRVDALAVGAILALVVRGPGGAWAARRWVQPVALVAAAGVCLVVLAGSAQYTAPLMSVVGYTAIDWTAAGVVMAAITIPPRLLTWAPLRAAGRYSYGLYVLHPFVNWWVIRHAPRWRASSRFTSWARSRSPSPSRLSATASTSNRSCGSRTSWRCAGRLHAPYFPRL